MLDKQLHNRRRLVRELYFAPVLSCAEFSEKIGKSLPLATRMLMEGLEEGIVQENGLAPSTGGRRPVTYSLQSGSMYLVSVAMDQFVTRIALMDTHNHPVGRVEKMELPLAGNPEALNQLAGHIARFVEGTGIPKEKIAGIGIGMPGFVDVRKGINHSFLKTPRGITITGVVAEKTGLPVYIDNDSSLIALAELRFGGARERKNAMVINIGWGVGLGIVVNGTLFRGHNGFAGEFSHIPLFSNGKMCSCGKTGCLETETSLQILVQKARAGLTNGRISQLKAEALDHYESASESMIEAAREGDRYTMELISEAAYHIGRGVSILIHLMNPELVILSGRGAAAGKVWLPAMQQAINEHSIPRIAADTAIELSGLGYQAELIGAAALVMEHFGEDAPEKTNRSEATASLHI